MKQFITLTFVVVIIAILVVSSPKAYFTNVPFQPGQEVEVIHYDTRTTVSDDLTNTTGTLKGITEEGLIILEVNGVLKSFKDDDVVGLNGTTLLVNGYGEPVISKEGEYKARIEELATLLAEKETTINELNELRNTLLNEIGGLKKSLVNAQAALKNRPVKNDPRVTQAKCKEALKKYRNSGVIPQLSKDSPPEADSACFISCSEY